MCEGSGELAVQDGQTVVFIGDSITDGWHGLLASRVPG